MPRQPQALLTTNARILRAVHTNPRMSLVELADALEVHETTIRRAVKELEAQGLLTRVRPGRRNRYTIHTDQKIDPESRGTVGDLLDLL